jgi:hypothetical protein
MYCLFVRMHSLLSLLVGVISVIGSAVDGEGTCRACYVWHANNIRMCP